MVPTMIDLDFQRYVERRKGRREAQAREGAAYAYGGDLKLLRTLDRVRPVKMALEATGRLWRGGRDELLAGAARVSDPMLLEAAERLRVPAPPAWATGALPPGCEGLALLGTDEEPTIFVEQQLLADLGDVERLDLFGGALGRIQNGHTVYATARYSLRHQAARFVRWVVAPALFALDRWAVRADLTADRAGLLCARDLPGAERALVRRVTGHREGLSPEALVAAIDATGNGAPPEPERIDVARAVLAEHPTLAPRLRALRLFAESAIYRGVVGQEGGLSPADVDAKVAELL
jgi:Zn-dependent protease with chaperone function